MATRMQQRRGTATQWTTANPILAPGEIGFESDTNQFKIGDGINHWDDLSYFKNLEDLGGSLDDYVLISTKGQANGVASLNAQGVIPSEQIPSLVGLDTEITTAVNNAVTALVDGAPAALNTLNELAAALGDDENYAATVTAALGTKAPIASPTFTGTVSGVTKAHVGLGNVDNTADAAKPVSTATQTALDLKASNTDLASHETGTTNIHGIADTAALATKAYADNIAAIEGGNAASDAEDYTDNAIAALTKSSVGLENVDNTADDSKPVSTAQASAISTAKTEAITEAATASDTKVSAHNAVTTNVHGIADTSLLATTTGAQTLTNKTLTTPTINGPEITATGGTPRIHGIYLPEPHFITFEGSTTNEFETVLTTVDPTADRTVSLPDASGTLQLRVADVSDVEIGYLNGVTSAIQTQMDAKAPLAAPAFTGTATAENLTLSGDLTVNGTTTNINSTSLVVEDKNIVLADVADPSDATADGGGITLKGLTDKTFNWVDSTDAWTSSEHINLASGKTVKINGNELVPALSSTTLNAATAFPTGVSSYVAYNAGVLEIFGNVNYAEQDVTAFNNAFPVGTYITITESGIETQAFTVTNAATLSSGAVAVNVTLDSGSGLSYYNNGWVMTSGTVGKYLTNDGTTSSWGTIPVTSAATPTALGTVFAQTDDTTIPGASSYKTVFGRGANSSDYSLAVGSSANASGETSIVVGTDSIAGDRTVVVGYQSANTYADGVSVGNNASLNGDSATAVGRGASAGTYSVAIGKDAYTDATDSLAIGTWASTRDANSTAVGAGAQTGEVFNTAVGATAIGSYAAAGRNGSIAIGKSAQSYTAKRIVIGAGAGQATEITRFTIPGMGIDWTSNPIPALSGATTINSDTAFPGGPSNQATLSTSLLEIFNPSGNYDANDLQNFENVYQVGDTITLTGTQGGSPKEPVVFTLTGIPFNMGGAVGIPLTITSGSAGSYNTWNISKTISQAGKYLTNDGTTTSWAEVESASSTLETNAIETTSYTLALSDKDKLIEMSSGMENYLNIPENSSVPFPIGTQIHILQTGMAPIYVDRASPEIVLNGTPGLRTRAQWSSATLIKRGTDMWVLIGDLSA